MDGDADFQAKAPTSEESSPSDEKPAASMCSAGPTQGEDKGDDDEDDGRSSSDDDNDDNDNDGDDGSSSEEDQSADDDSSSEEEQSADDGLSDYERLRLERIARNRKRLAQLGLLDTIAKKSGHGQNKGRKREKKEEDLVATRSQPKRTVKTSRLTHEQLHGPDVRRVKEVKPAQPKTPKKEKYIPGTCYKCKGEDDERIYCVYCRHEFHSNCHEPKIELPLPEGQLFRCSECTSAGKIKRLACGFCEACTRLDDDCGTCVYCIDSKLGEGVRKKCVMKRCLASFDIQPMLPKKSPTPSPEKSVTDLLVDDRADAASDSQQIDSETLSSPSASSEVCHVCRDGGVLICCDDCDRVYHSACHKPMLLNVYARLHCQECKREERERAIELSRQRAKERKTQKRLAAGALAGIVDDRIVFVKVIGPVPSCVVCGVSKKHHKPIPLPPAKRVLYASLNRGKKVVECVVKWPQDTFAAAAKQTEEISKDILQEEAPSTIDKQAATDESRVQIGVEHVHGRADSSSNGPLQVKTGKTEADGKIKVDSSEGDEYVKDGKPRAAGGQEHTPQSNSDQQKELVPPLESYEDEPILDAIVIDEDGDDFEVKCRVKWPHENPDALLSDDMIYCKICGDWYHLHCYSPPIVHRDKGGPRGKFRCGKCIQLRKASTPKRPRLSIETTDMGSQSAPQARNLPGPGRGGSRRCHECVACKRTDCGSCRYCRDKPKFGGQHRLRQMCIMRRCELYGSQVPQSTRKVRCGECERCIKKDCGKCRHCRDKPKFGGSHLIRKPCELKVCKTPKLAMTTSLPGITTPPRAVATAASASASASGRSSIVTAPSAVEESLECVEIKGTIEVHNNDSEINSVYGAKSPAYITDNGVRITTAPDGKIRYAKLCCIEGCEKNARGNKFEGMCQSHYYAKHPEAAKMGPIYVKLCRVMGCERNSRGVSKWNGFCMNHYKESTQGIVHEYKAAVEHANSVPRKKAWTQSMKMETVGKEGRGEVESADRDKSKRPISPQAEGGVDAAESSLGEIQHPRKKQKLKGKSSFHRKEEQKVESDEEKKIVKKTKMETEEEGEKEIKKQQKELDPVSKKIKKIINSARNHPEDPKKQDLACESLRKFACDKEDARKIFALGGLDMMIAAMEGHPESAMVQAEAIGTLADLIWIDPKNGERVLERGCAELVCAAMALHDAHPKLQKMANGFFRVCTYDEANVEHVKKCGTPAVIASMKRNLKKVDVVWEGAIFLQNMIVVYSDLAQSILRRKRGESEHVLLPNLLVDIARSNPDHSGLHEAVFGALSVILAVNQRAKTVISDAGALPVMITSFKNAKAEHVALKQAILSALKILVVDDDSTRATIVQAGGIKLIVAAMKEYPNEAVMNIAACGVLKALSQNDKSNAIDIASEGTARLIVALMDKFSDFDDLQTACCSLLSVMKHDASKTTVAVAKRVLSAMENHTDIEHLQEEACHALNNFISSDGTSNNVLPLLKTRDVREILSSVKETFPTSKACGEIVDELLEATSNRSRGRR